MDRIRGFASESATTGGIRARAVRVAIALAVIAGVIVATLQEAEAGYCYGVPEGVTQWVCTTTICAAGPVNLRKEVRHLPTTPHCTVLDTACDCF